MFWYPSQCSTNQALTPIENCGMTRSLTDVERETVGPENQVIQTVEANGGSTLQLRDYVCQAGNCATNFGNSWNYIDGTHITVHASQRLGPELATRLLGKARP